MHLGNKKIRSQAGRKLFNESRGEISNLDAFGG